jgi:hypothetical protein
MRRRADSTVRYEVDLATDTIVAADSTVSRLPYRGLCDEPQGPRARHDPQSATRSCETEPDLARRRNRLRAAFGVTGDVLKLLELGS